MDWTRSVNMAYICRVEAIHSIARLEVVRWTLDSTNCCDRAMPSVKAFNLVYLYDNDIVTVVEKQSCRSSCDKYAPW
jgi:hypothetical protein